MHPSGREVIVALARDRWVVVDWRVPAAEAPDLAAVDALARLALAARRAGCELRVTGPTPALHSLLHLCGLVEAVASVQVGREPEGVEQAVVEEAVVADDPVA
jgi:hypothetical protein